MTKLLREGDIVSVTGKIRHSYTDDDKTVFIDLDGYHSPVMLSVDRVTLVAPRIDVGESVRWANGNEGTVLASDADKLWVKLDDGSYAIWPAKEVTVLVLKAADPELVEPPPAPLDSMPDTRKEVE